MKYKLSELIKGDSPNLYYFIPPEIVTRSIHGKTCSVHMGAGGWVFCRKMNWYLDQLGWTDQQWYNVFILGIGRYESPKCPECGRPLQWNGRISWGGYYQYCSLGCSQVASGRLEHIRQGRSERLISKWKDDDYVEFMTNPTKNMHRYAAWSRGANLRNATNAKIGWFYITYNDHELKVGISLSTPERSRRVIDGEVLLYKGNPYNVIDCEYQFKLDHASDLLYPNYRGHCSQTEIFKTSTLSDAIKYADNYNLTLVTE